jgi:hypothetical protein
VGPRIFRIFCQPTREVLGFAAAVYSRMRAGAADDRFLLEDEGALGFAGSYQRGAQAAGAAADDHEINSLIPALSRLPQAPLRRFPSGPNCGHQGVPLPHAPKKIL